MAGLPLSAGKGSSGQEGALSPIRGAAERSTGFGEHHDEASVENVILCYGSCDCVEIKDKRR